MPLILAIEPDRRQASQLTAMVRGRLHAELVLADSAERALTALGDRVPDLVLTSALLSPKDETALGERLRALDGQAAHVQTLTIPVLATTSGRGSGRANGVLSALRREKSRPAAPEGCDPAVFAEQCKEYLERAATDRAALLDKAASGAAVKEPVRPPAPSPVTGAEWVVVREEQAAAADEPQAAVQPEPVWQPQAEPAPQADTISEFDYLPADAVARASEKAPIYTPPSYRTPAGIIVPEYDAAGGYAPEAAVEPIDAAPSVAVEQVIAQPSVIEPSVDELPAVTAATAETVREAAERSPRVDRVLKEFLDLTSNDSEGPASLLAAVAALEAEEQSYVAAAAETISEPPQEDAPPPVVQAAIAPEEAPREEPDFLDLSSLLQPAAAASETPAYNDDASVDVYEIDPKTLGGADRLATLSDLEDIFKNTPEFAPATAPAAAPKTDPANGLENLKEWDDIVEALRRDAEQLESGRPANGEEVANAAPLPQALDLPPVLTAPEPTTEAAASAEAAPEEPADAAADANGAKRKRKRAKASPAQDEWGFFDPDQCGFAALIEKLEEINDKDDTPAPRGA